MSEPDPAPVEGKDTGGHSGTVYSVLVGLVFVAIIAIAGINAVQTGDGGVLGADDERDKPLAQFAVPDVRSELTGDANIAQDDCEVAAVPCPEGDLRAPACKVDLDGALRVCDLFAKPLVLSFWFTRGGDCESEQDVFERVFRRFRERVNFLAIDVRDSRAEVRQLIAERGWTHPIGLDPDGALSNLYRVGGCPTLVFAYPGGIVQSTAIGTRGFAEVAGRVGKLIVASRRRALADA